RVGDNEPTCTRFIKNPYLELDKRRGLKAAELLVTRKIDKLFIKESLEHKSAFYVLEGAYVELEKTDADTIEAIVKEIKT
ncbi:MAG: hypothetical protein JJE19_08415, partial [Methanosarcinales archaeon]|nr:hypothetical protein [Methanosarcinales archaeon]